jgi:LysR family transcriptional regulator, glycine cleavage system transcriptional activator
MTRSDLPPLASLRAFEAAARRASFKLAAEELFVTPTAISHHVRQLETYLGVRVLNRTPRAVTLTAEGNALYGVTASGFDEIAKVVARLRGSETPKTLTLSSTTAFLNHWLAPRMGELRRLHPEIDLRLHASNDVVELRSGGIEAAIRYGKGPFAGAAGIALCDDAFAPVCSPRLGLTAPKDLRRATLIHIEGRSRPKPLPDWQRWCAMAGVADIDTSSGLRFPDSLLAVQAAIAGQGVAIVSLTLVADALAAGLLEVPFKETLDGETYHFACAMAVEARPDIVTLRNWFVQAMSR